MFALLDNGKPTTHNSWRVISQPGEIEKHRVFLTILSLSGLR